MHANDFAFEGPAEGLKCIVGDLRKHWLVKVRALPGPDDIEDKEVPILNRVVRWASEGIKCEADPPHVEKLLRDLDVTSCRVLASLGVKLVAPEREDGELIKDDTLSLEEKTLFRCGDDRCNYLSSDRAGITFATKKLSRRMSAPTVSDMVALKRLCRYPKRRPRLIQLITSGPRSALRELKVYVDTDWAECRKTRKPRNGGCLVLAGVRLKLWPTTQAVRALSSGEVEYYFALKGASPPLGFQSMAKYLGETINIRLVTDSVAAQGTMGRRGLGKVRHIEVGNLWLQDLVADRRLQISKVKGVESPADLGTKLRKAEDIDKHLSTLLFQDEVGRSSAVLGI